MSLALVEGKYFRVYPSTKVVGVRQNGDLVVENQGVEKGLAIERKDGNNYYVVAFVRPNDILEDVDFRTVDIIDESLSIEDCWEMLQEYKNCVEFARQTLLDLEGD